MFIIFTQFSTIIFLLTFFLLATLRGYEAMFTDTWLKDVRIGSLYMTGPLYRETSTETEEVQSRCDNHSSTYPNNMQHE